MSAEALSAALNGAAHWLNTLAEDGPDLRVKAHVKAAHEAAELAEEPSLEEWADVAITLVGTALHHGWGTGQLADAVTAKVAVNAERTWGQTEDGSWQHIEREPLLCPECQNGKTVNCVGVALDFTTDDFAVCANADNPTTV